MSNRHRAIPLPQTPRPRRPVVDLFAGAGGLSQGFRDAGFTVVQAVDCDHNAMGTYAANHPTTDPICADIRKLDPATCLRRVGLRPGQIAAVIGGPPCQGFSESNRRTRILANPRNHLYRDFLRFVEYIQPRWVVLENVGGLRTFEHGLIVDAITTSIRRVGYFAEWLVLNAAKYGVPQVRRRVFMVASRCRLAIPRVLEEKTHPVTVRDAIADLPQLGNGASTDLLAYATEPKSRYQKAMRQDSANLVSGNLVTRNADYVLARYEYIPQGSNWTAIPRRLMGNYTNPKRCHTGIYHRLSWHKPSKVIGNFRKNMLVHPRDNRGLSIREAARLQSFPDSYCFHGSIGFRQQQVADAVPPILARAVATAVLRSAGVDIRTTNHPSHPPAQTSPLPFHDTAGAGSHHSIETDGCRVARVEHC